MHESLSELAHRAVLLSMLQVNMEGVTGQVSFEQGRRDHFQLDVLQLISNGLVKVGILNCKVINFSAIFSVFKQFNLSKLLTSDFTEIDVALLA